jgi:uncharacterized repeat protein (TIGR01451 family)
MRTFVISTLAATLLLAASAQAAPAQPGAITVESLAEQEVEVKLPNGKTEKKRQPVAKAMPGSEVIYTTRFTNQGKQPAGNIAITNPVPENTSYVGGSAFGNNTAITYSLDGKTYATPDKLTVKTPEGKQRPALPAEYSHIRWTYQGDLPVGKTGEVGFRVLIK